MAPKNQIPDLSAVTYSSKSVTQISIAVCTHNGAVRLPRVLHHIVESFSNVSFEVLIIDNGSNPPIELQQLLKDPNQAFPTKITLIQVSQLGLVYARLAAIRAAKSDLLAFVDDDNFCMPTYCQEILKWASCPKFGYLGVTLALPDSRKENELDADLLSTFAIGSAAKSSGKLPKGRTVWGAGLVINRKAASTLLECGYTPLLTGRQGAKQIAGDDSELCIMLSSVGLEGYFSSVPCVLHDVAETRFTQANYQKTRVGFALASATLTTLRKVLAHRAAAISPTWSIASAMVSTIRLVLGSLIASSRPRHLNSVFYVDQRFKLALAIAYAQGICLLFKNRALIRKNRLATGRMKLSSESQLSPTSKCSTEIG